MWLADHKTTKYWGGRHSSILKALTGVILKADRGNFGGFDRGNFECSDRGNSGGSLTGVILKAV